MKLKGACIWWILSFLSRFAAVVYCFAGAGLAESLESNKYPGASHVPDSQPGWERFLIKVDPDPPKDEPQGGRTGQGSPVVKRIEECFPAEPRNLFWEVDRIASGPGGTLERLNYDVDGDGKISDQERDATGARLRTSGFFDSVGLAATRSSVQGQRVDQPARNEKAMT